MSQVRRTRIEDYLAAIDNVCEEGGQALASTGAIATAIGVSKGTASNVLKKLAEISLIEHVPYQGARLTDAGRSRARRVARRYRLMELFLSRTLGIELEAVHDEAWRLEPAASEQLIEHMDRFLASPEFGPRGDPIPRADGTLPERHAAPLTTCAVGAKVVFQRVKGHSASLLRFLRKVGLAVGAEMLVKDNSAIGGVIVLELATGVQTIGYPIASQILVGEAQLGKS